MDSVDSPPTFATATGCLLQRARGGGQHPCLLPAHLALEGLSLDAGREWIYLLVLGTTHRLSNPGSELLEIVGFVAII